MLHVITWQWGSKYPGYYSARLAAAVARNLVQPHRFMVCAPSPADKHLTDIPGCFARLRVFDPAWQSAHGIRPGDRILNLDLDLVVTGRLDGLVNRTEPFVILQGVNAANPGKFNGSFWCFDAGYRPDVWSKFSPGAAAKVPWYAFPDDQSWMEAMIPDAGAVGPADGVFGFQKPGWVTGDELPAHAKIVAFFGRRDPSQFAHIPWVKRHWIG